LPAITILHLCGSASSHAFECNDFFSRAIHCEVALVNEYTLIGPSSRFGRRNPVLVQNGAPTNLNLPV
jgi:hypothetical protein